MLQGRPIVWIAENKLLAAVTALALVAVTVSVAALVARDGTDIAGSLTDDPLPSEGSASTDDASGGGSVDDDDAGSDAGVPGTVGGGGTGVGSIGGDPILPGTKPVPRCSPKAVDATGITKDTITIGQIVTDVNQLPQQLRPAHEGLKAYVDLVNRSGGVCGRELRLEYRNDNLNVQQHITDYQSLAGQVFAFVANESLLESSDYDGSPPFAPRFTDDGEPVPDVGGLAFGYGRSQSAWHAGVIGSLSPVLVGGGQFKGFAQRAKAAGTPCTKGALVYLREPTGASEDQARLGEVAVRESWGAGVGAGNTRLYAANLQDPVPVYQALIQQMVSDGMNCAFSYADLGSNVNLVRAMANEGVWPPSKCTRGAACFRVVYVPLAAYDARFVQDAGDASLDVQTFIPHLPVNETGHQAMKAYLAALKRSFPDATPSTFSIVGFTSGQLFVEALQSCGAAPTRTCVMTYLRALEGFTSGGMLGGTTPFRTSKATFGSYGTWNWKHIFNHTIALRVTDRGGKRDFYRTAPTEGFLADTIKVARGTPG